MPTRIERHTDQLTGEQRVYEVEDVDWVAPKKTDHRGKAAEKREFVMEIRDMTWRTDDLTVVEHRVWNALKRRMQFGEPFYLSTKEIATELNMIPSWVSRTLRSLREKELLIPLQGRWFLLDPRVVWIGSDRDRRKWIGRLYNARRLSLELAHLRTSPHDEDIVQNSGHSPEGTP